MRNIDQLILDEFSPSTLEEIIKFGKYKLYGFRLNGPSSKVKTNMMKSTLLRDNKLKNVLYNYAKAKVEKQMIDNTWSLVNEIDIEILNERLKYSKRENVLLELLSSKKIEEIERILVINDETNKEVAATKEISNENEIYTLRAIINRLEVENRDLRKLKEKEQSDNKTLNTRLTIVKQEKDDLKNKVSKRQREIIDVEKIIDHLKTENSNFKKLVSEKEMYITKLERENQQINVLVYGGDKTKDWFKINNSQSMYAFTYANENLDIERNQNNIVEIWVISSHIGSKELRKIKKEKWFNEFELIQRVRFFDTFDEIKEYMDKLEELLWIGNNKYGNQNF